MVVLVVVVLLVAGVAKACSFSPAGPSVDSGAVPSVNAPDALRSAAGLAGFPIRVPAVPVEWRANSASQDTLDGSRVVRVGWITESGHYLRLVQSTADEGALVASETAVSGGGRGAPSGRGPVQVAGLQWVVYQGGNGEAAWVAQLDGVRLLITGNGSDDEFRALAGATASGQVLPAHTG